MFRFLEIALWGMLACCPVALAETLNGAGATFPYPVYAKWFDSYQVLHPDVEISYRDVGSGEGIKQILSGAVDFGASDGPMTEEQLKEAESHLRISILHFPTVLGAAVPAYNLPGVSGDLRFRGSA